MLKSTGSDRSASRFGGGSVAETSSGSITTSGVLDASLIDLVAAVCAVSSEVAGAVLWQPPSKKHNTTPCVAQANNFAVIDGTRLLGPVESP